MSFGEELQFWESVRFCWSAASATQTATGAYFCSHSSLWLVMLRIAQEVWHVRRNVFHPLPAGTPVVC